MCAGYKVLLALEPSFVALIQNKQQQQQKGIDIDSGCLGMNSLIQLTLQLLNRVKMTTYTGYLLYF